MPNMIERIRARHATVLLVVVTSACSTTLVARAPEETSPSAVSSAPPAAGSAIGGTADAETNEVGTTDTGTIAGPVQTTAPTTSAPHGEQSPTTAPPTTVPPTTVPPTTTTEPEIDLPPCTAQVQPDDTFESIAARRRSGSGVELWAENGFVDRPSDAELVDICAGNGIDDLTGETRLDPTDAELAGAVTENVRRQQTKLNELFVASGMSDLDVDGASGPLTGQRLCAARLALGLPTTIADMAAGSNEQNTLFGADRLRTPDTAPVDRDRWVLIDRTCQIMFVGSHAETLYIFPTSTGSEGFETRDQSGADVFRYNPAIENGGWHNSSEFPVGVDNPLNGNLWKPLYFDLGQAIHGANNVPPTPQSKGCARLRLDDQALLLDWLGLNDVLAETWRKPEIDLAVSVQGAFVPRDS